MLIEIDSSLLTPTSAIGRIYGQLELAALPRVGERVSLILAANPIAGFDGQLTVEHITSSAVSPATLMLSLSDLVATDEESAKQIAAKLESAYGLFFDPYEQE